MFPMKAYISLVFALGMIALIEFADAYTRYRKDWRGLSVLPSLFGQMAVPEFAVIFAYIEALDFSSETPFLKNYILWLAAGAGLIAHFLPQKLLGKKWEIVLDQPFTKQRMDMATTLVSEPYCRAVLSLSITDANLSTREMQELKELLANDPLTDEHVLYVIKRIGTVRVGAACDAYSRRRNERKVR